MTSSTPSSSSALNVLGRHLDTPVGTAQLVRAYRLSDETRAAGAWQALAGGAFINRGGQVSMDQSTCQEIRESLPRHIAAALDDVRPDAAVSAHVRTCGPCSRALSQALAIFAYTADVEFGLELATDGIGTRAFPLPGTGLAVTVTIEEDTAATALKGTRRVAAVIRLDQHGQTLPVAVDGHPRYAVQAQVGGLRQTPVTIDDDMMGYVADDLAPSDVRAFVVKVRPELGWRDTVEVAPSGALAVTLADGRPAVAPSEATTGVARRRWFGFLSAS